MNREIEDYELRVYGISETYIKKRDDLVDITSLENQDITDEEWVEEAEQFGYSSTLDTFIHNINSGMVAKDYPHLKFKFIAIGKYKEETTEEMIVDIVPTNKLHYIIRD